MAWLEPPLLLGTRGIRNGWLTTRGSAEGLEEGMIHRDTGGQIKKSQWLGKVPCDNGELQGARAAGPPGESSK